jgi:hypothetical protein
MFGKNVEPRVVDNRTFILGLDKFYRDAIKPHERGELLKCARRVAAVLHLQPGNVPVEGYYAEDQQLTEYFLLMRALQLVKQEHTKEVASLGEFQRLWDVTSAPLYGKSQHTGKLFPVGRDALSRALYDTQPEWTLERLTETACKAAEEMDDFSLVGLAARIRDPVVLTATRESVVLYFEQGAMLAPRPPKPKYIWKVDKELAEQARRFIDAFRVIFGDQLPPPEPGQAKSYWHACKNTYILGRCVRLGYNDAVTPVLQYHWAICRGNDDSFHVQEFWHTEVWTTIRYRRLMGHSGRCPDL